MDRNQYIRLADEQLRKVVNHYNNLYSPSGETSAIELDLILEELRKLYTTFKTISNLKEEDFPVLVSHSTNQTTQQAVYKESAAPYAEDKQEPKAVMQEMPVNEDRKEERLPLANVEVQKQEELPLKEDPIVEQAKLKEEELPAVTEETNPHPSVSFEVTQTAQPPITEKQDMPIWNDRFSANNNANDLNLRFSSSNINDINDAINLNDKFTFISKLFNNNTSEYHDTLDKINKAQNFNEANHLFLAHYNAAWDENKDACMKLVEIIKRRFNA